MATKRGRKRKWNPLTTIPPTPVQQTSSPYEIVIDQYFLFCESNKLSPGPQVLIQFGQAQLKSGLSQGTVLNNLEILKPINYENFEGYIERHRLGEFRRSIQKQYRPKAKPLYTISQLGQIFKCTTAIRELRYQCFFYLLVATGCRPEELQGEPSIEYRLTNRGLEVQFAGRKNGPSGRVFEDFKFEYSMAPPSHLLPTLRENQAKRKFSIGTKKNIATCINSWLRKFRDILNLPELTSTCPRVRMDNVLRNFVDSQEMSVQTYERMMGHTIKVSDVSYRRE